MWLLPKRICPDFLRPLILDYTGAAVERTKWLWSFTSNKYWICNETWKKIKVMLSLDGSVFQFHLQDSGGKSIETDEAPFLKQPRAQQLTVL